MLPDQDQTQELGLESFSAQDAIKEVGKSSIQSPPYACSPGWIIKFFELAKTMKLTIIDRAFVGNYIVASKNESKVTNALKFLQLIDKDGNITAKVSLLKAEGEVFKQNLRKIVEEAYSDLITNLPIETVKADVMNAYFTDPKRCNYTLPQAKAATNFFVWIAKEAGMTLSPDLSNIKSDPKPRDPSMGETRSKKEHDSKVENLIEPAPKQGSQTIVNKVVLPSLEKPSLSNIQATITMSLDKDTPIDVWRMVLRLLGLSDQQSEHVN